MTPIGIHTSDGLVAFAYFLPVLERWWIPIATPDNKSHIDEVLHDAATLGNCTHLVGEDISKPIRKLAIKQGLLIHIAKPDSTFWNTKKAESITHTTTDSHGHPFCSETAMAVCLAEHYAPPRPPVQLDLEQVAA